MIRRLTAPGLIALLLLTGCTASDGSPESTATVSPTAQSTSVPEPASSVEPEPDAEIPDEDDAVEQSAEEAYRAWLTASREPDVDLACSYLTDELVEKMLAEMAGRGYSGVNTCEDLTTMTAELYRTFDQSADIQLTTVTETATHAELFVTFVDGGDCGTVVMDRTPAGWIITDQSEGCRD